MISRNGKIIRAHLRFWTLRLKYPRVRKHEDLEGILDIASVAHVDNSKAVELIKRLKSVFSWSAPVDV